MKSWQEPTGRATNNPMCHHGRKIQDYFARKTMMRVPNPVCSADPSLSDFWFFGYAKKRIKNQIITGEEDLEHKLTNV
jgi:hypothetical protein